MQVSNNFYHDGKCADEESATLSLPVLSLSWGSSVQKLVGKPF